MICMFLYVSYMINDYICIILHVPLHAACNVVCNKLILSKPMYYITTPIHICDISPQQNHG